MEKFNIQANVNTITINLIILIIKYSVDNTIAGQENLE